MLNWSVYNVSLEARTNKNVLIMTKHNIHVHQRKVSTCNDRALVQLSLNCINNGVKCRKYPSVDRTHLLKITSIFKERNTMFWKLQPVTPQFIQ